MNELEFVAWCVGQLEELIAREGADTIAAFIGEPALGTGGLAAARRLRPAIQAVLRQHDIPLIADEVVTGFDGSAPCSGRHATASSPT